MNMDELAARGLVLLGCGKMGSAMLEGWLSGSLPASSVWVRDPRPSDWLSSRGVHLNTALPEDPAVVLVAVKPQMMAEALPELQAFGGGRTIFLSVAAGTPIRHFEEVLGAKTPVIRAMPNTPAAIRRGITAIVGNEHVAASELDLAEGLLSAIGRTVRLDTEAQIDAVTGLSGSGPAYVFHMIEAMAAAGEAQGLPPEMAMQLAISTVAGAGALAEMSEDTAEQLRINVTSPNGTTQAGLDVLMAEDGLKPLIGRTVAAAVARSKELANG
ncbi:MAG: pyrroline-5-carboxylate reductase [Rhodobacteraceae bacterium]|nr:pyrroline-5-carboxylate reductase [Paracoccaceae bacterium]